MMRTNTNHRDALVERLRDVRRAFDQLPRGEQAQLRRCRSAAELVLERAYWRVVSGHAQLKNLEHVVLLFPAGGQRTQPRFSVGRYLRVRLGDEDGAALRFRRLLACRDHGELDHRMRGILRLVDANEAPVDWGVLGVDLLWFFLDSDNVRPRWAQDFYAPSASSSQSSTHPQSQPEA